MCCSFKEIMRYEITQNSNSRCWIPEISALEFDAYHGILTGAGVHKLFVGGVTNVCWEDPIKWKMNPLSTLCRPPDSSPTKLVWLLWHDICALPSYGTMVIVDFTWWLPMKTYTNIAIYTFPHIQMAQVVQRIHHWVDLVPWWRHQLETFSALLAICAGNSPVSGEFLAQRPVTRSFGVFFDLRLIKRS